MPPRSPSYAESFLQYFDVHYASRPHQRDDVGRIRYRVYCEEFAFEPRESFPDGIERDEYDSQSLQCLVTHKTTGTPAGCVRLVPPDNRLEGRMPFEKHCAQSLDQDFFAANEFPRESVCEVSRLAVDGQFRRRSGESATRFGGINITDLSKQEQRTFPLVAISCFLAATALTDMVGRPNAFAMMEPFLPRLMARSGIVFTRVGEDIDYHGLRAPYFNTTASAVDGMAPELRELYDAIHQVIKADFQSA